MELVRDILGIGEEELNAAEMVARAIVVYVIAVAIVRVGKKRFLGRATAFDVILAVVLGSIISRVITGNAPFVPGLAACLALVGMHWFFSGIGIRWESFNSLVKGNARLLVRDGVIDWDMMRKTHLTENDLREDLREKGVVDLSEVAEARLERSGRVSVVTRG